MIQAAQAAQFFYKPFLQFFGFLKDIIIVFSEGLPASTSTLNFSIMSRVDIALRISIEHVDIIFPIFKPITQFSYEVVLSGVINKPYIIFQLLTILASP